ncbi:MAG: esterase-like activity of phytase family protein [Planctomycetota bacterium]
MLSPTLAATAAALLVAPAFATAQGLDTNAGPFQRIASFPVYLNTSIDDETVAEIVSVSEDGNTLVYTDSEIENLGFVDITDPANPTAAGVVALGGEPTSVAVAGPYALVSINTSVDFVNTSGDLLVVDIASRTIVETIPLGGQPDAIAVSDDNLYAAIAIENERDEDLGDGEPPQLPAGFLVIVDLIGLPGDWTTRTVELTGIADVFPDDPEPEFVDINELNIVAVTLQENNHIVTVDLASGVILSDFSAGTVDLTDVDNIENDLIEQGSSLGAVPREPDAIAWTSFLTFATADEGDLFGGSRGFTTFIPFGPILFEAGNTLEHLVARIGHYPEARSENKGNEPEGVEFGEYSDARYLFVGSERSSVVFVYSLFEAPILGALSPVLVQVLPTGVGPEGLLAIPDRDLFVVANEVDERDAKIRSTLMIYSRNGDGDYPDIESDDRAGESVPIPWGALSALAVSPSSDDVLYTVHDSFYIKSRVYEIDRSQSPARIVAELPLLDSTDVLGNALRRVKLTLPGADDFAIGSLLNDDDTVNLDLEGIAVAPNGTTLWAVSEGAGNLVGGVSDPSDRPLTSPNLLLELERNPMGTGLEIVSVIGIPFELQNSQLRFGLEGVTFGDDGALYVCFQREWSAAGDPSGLVRIGRFDPMTGSWTFAHYPLDAATSPFGGWVGLSEIANIGGGRLAILERDNQGGPDAAVKRIYSIDVDDVTFRAVTETLDVFTKTLESDVLATSLFDDLGVLPFEKLEGMTILSNGDTLIVNDNDGVDDNSGETRILTLPGLFN